MYNKLTWLRRKIKNARFFCKNRFSYESTWNLDVTFAKFIYPRLKYHRDHSHSYPGLLTMEEWEEILDKMLFSFDIFRTGQIYDIDDKEMGDRVQEGLELFGKWYGDLWD